MKIEIDTEKFDKEIDRICREYEDKAYSYAEKALPNGARLCFELSNEIKNARRVFWSYVDNGGKINVNDL